MRVANLLLAGLIAVACGCGSGGGGPGAAPDGGQGGAGGGAFMPAPHPALPQVVTLGGPILTAPKVQPLIYGNDSGATDMQAFLHELTTTSFWSGTTAEYGVGKLTVLPAITLAASAPATITTETVMADLATNTSGPNPAWGAADPSTIYLFLLPAGTTEQDTLIGASCMDFDGFHDEALVGAINVPYAIIADCPGYDGPDITDTQQRTIAVSHELVESATDPFPETDPAYAQEDDADVVWTPVTDGEVADMCEFNDDAFYTPPGSTYTIQRIWSNAAAAQTQNPCVPHGSIGPYFNSVPALGTVGYNPGDNGTYNTQGVLIPIGQSKVIDIKLFSTAPTAGPWTVSAYDYSDLVLGAPANLLLSLDKSSGQNGDTLHLTVTVKSAETTRIDGEAFLLFSDYGQPGDPDFQENGAMGLVINN